MITDYKDEMEMLFSTYQTILTTDKNLVAHQKVF